MGGWWGVRWDTFLIVNKRINSDLFERMALSFSARRIGIFTSQNGRLIVVHECGGGGVEIWIMGDVFNCQQNINHAKFKRIQLLDSAHLIGIFQGINYVYILLKLKANSRWGGFSKLEMGLVLNCRRSVNGSMAKQMAGLDSARQIGLFTTQTES